MIAWVLGQSLSGYFSQPFCPADTTAVQTIPDETQPTYPYSNCSEYYNGGGGDAGDWCRGGSYFLFASGAGVNTALTGGGVRIWWRCDGPLTGPAVLFIHGYPTSSFDTWAPTSRLLESTHRVCHVDHQGYGFSDKPRAPYYYSIYEHAAALDHFVTHVAQLSSFAIATHDMGSSVGFAFLEKFYNPATRLSGATPPAYTITHHLITNGNIWLPLSQLSVMQLAYLDNRTGPLLETSVNDPASTFPSGTICSLFNGQLNPFTGGRVPVDCDGIRSATNYREGRRVTSELMQYLQQRACYESNWLSALNASTVNATLVWGQTDPVAPPSVADYVWSNGLATRPSGAPARYLRVSLAGHFACHDEAALYACLLRDPRADCTAQTSDTLVEAGCTHADC